MTHIAQHLIQLWRETPLKVSRLTNLKTASSKQILRATTWNIQSTRLDWTKSIEKMKFNQFVDDAAEKFEVARAVSFADLAKQAQLQAQFS